MKKIGDIVKENTRRKEVFNLYYNPITGEGSPLKRVSVNISEFGTLYLPVSMLEVHWVKDIIELGSIWKYVYINHIYSNDPINDIILGFITERYRHDFEFWASTTIFIQDAETLQDIHFVLRKAQRKLLLAFETMRLADKPIRVILDKARQWGGSTLTQIYMMWIQQIHKQNWHLAVCAQSDDAAKNINAMYSRAADLYPIEVGKITLKSYERSPKNRICTETGGIIGVGSYMNDKQFRSFNYPMIHLSEVAWWEDSLKRKGERVAQSLRNTVKYVPYSMIVLESTANGIGNFFHNEWLAAVEGRSRYVPVFIAWWEIDMYQMEILISYDQFISEMTDYDWSLWNMGATLEGINWYNQTKVGENKSEWEMHSEFPSSAEESFESTGHKYFDPIYISAVAKDVKKPWLIGEIFSDGRMGPDAFNNISIRPTSNGYIWLWAMPDKKSFVKNRYAAFADIGGKTPQADYSVLRIIDRLWMIDGNDPEFILTFRTHMDQDLFAWKCAKICMAYAIPEIGEYPLLAIESNSLRKAEQEGDHFLTVLDTISGVYPNLYIRNDIEKVGDGYTPKYGFQTTEKSKGMILDAHNAAARERYLSHTDQQETWGYIERDQRAVNEMKWYEIKPDGKLGAVSGQHDDIEICTAGCIWLSTSFMPDPFFLEGHSDNRRRRSVKRESGF